MDYLQWELERQRGALRALLGGGDNEAPREEEAGGGPAGPEARGKNAAGRRGPTGKSGAGGAYPAVLEAVRGDRSRLPEGEKGAPEPPVSAWEQVLAGEEGAPGQGDRPEGRAPETRRTPPREGTGPSAALPGLYGGDLPARGTESAERFENAGENRAGEAGGEEASQHYTAAVRLARRRPIWAAEPGEASGGTGFRSGGGTAAAAAEDGARALSRAVQRDARRYDGGFTIY